MRLLLRILAIFLLFQVALRVLRKTFHFPAPAFIGRLLDSDVRLRTLSPGTVIRRSGIQEGMTMIDLGCGPGAYTLAFARAVGPAGRVYAVDVQPAMLERLEAKLARPENADVMNVETRLANAERLPFESESIDLVAMVTVLEEIPDRQAALAEVRRVLEPGGILAVTESLVDPDYTLTGTTVDVGQAAGFSHQATAGNLWSYTVRFAKPA